MCGFRVWARLTKQEQESSQEGLGVTLSKEPGTGSTDSSSSKFFGSPIDTSTEYFAETSVDSSPGGERQVWAPLCMCLLTRVPVVRQLQYWLVQAYDHIDRLLPQTYDGLLESSSGSALASLFRSHIVQLTQEVPLPVPGEYNSCIHLYYYREHSHSCLIYVYRFFVCRSTGSEIQDA